jgi:hypothetical protein
MWYDIALFLHVIGAIGLFSANSLSAAGIIRMRQGQTIAQIRDGASLTGGAVRGIPASSVLILLSALYLVLRSWSFATPWVLASLIAVVVLALGNAIIGRPMRGIRQALNGAQDGPVPPQLRAQVRHPAIWLGTTTSNALLVGIVFLMTVKPDLSGTLIALGVALVLGVAIGLITTRSRPSQQSGAAVTMAATPRG